MNYQDFKKKVEDNRDKIVIGFCFILVFLVGFGSGRFTRSLKPNQQSYANYNTNLKQKPAQTANAEGDSPLATPTVAGAATTTAISANCPVKGNISAKGKKIYHIPTGAFYKRVKPEQCFNTEAEALAAGFVKSSR